MQVAQMTSALFKT